MMMIKFTQESCQVQLHFSLIRHWQFSEGYLFCFTTKACFEITIFPLFPILTSLFQ